jgi:hypothetical protein
MGSKRYTVTGPDGESFEREIPDEKLGAIPQGFTLDAIEESAPAAPAVVPSAGSATGQTPPPQPGAAARDPYFDQQRTLANQSPSYQTPNQTPVSHETVSPAKVPTDRRWVPEDTRGVFRKAYDSLRETSPEGAVRGVALGTTGGYAPRFAPQLVGAVQAGLERVAPVDDPEVPTRSYPEGSLRAATTASDRSAYGQAESQSPIATGVGKAIGTTPYYLAAAPYAAAVKGASFAANAARASGVLGGVGALEKMHTGDPLEIAKGAGFNAALGAGSHYVGGKVSQLADAAEGALEKGADMWRAASAGAYGAQLKNLIQERGPEYVRELGKAIERLHIDQRGAESMLPRWFPQGAESIMGRAGTVRREIGSKIGSIIDEATAAGGGTHRVYVSRSLRQAAKQLEGPNGIAIVPSDQGKAAALRDAAARVEANGEKFMSNRELFDLKKAFESEAGFSGLKTPGETATARGYEAAADVPRKLNLQTIRRQQGEEVGSRLEAAKEDFGFAKTAEDLAQGRYYKELGNQIVSLPSAGHGVSGAAIGGPVGAAAGIAASQGLKHYGRDVGASAMRSGQELAGEVSRAALTGREVLPLAAGVAGATTTPPEAQRALVKLQADPRAFGDLSNAVRQAAQEGDVRRMNYLISAYTMPQQGARQ